MNIRSNCHKLVLFVFFVIYLNTCGVFARFDWKDGGKPFWEDDISIPSYYLKKNSFGYSYENHKENSTLNFEAYLTYRLKKIYFDAPLLQFNNNKYGVALGAQTTGRNFTFLQRIPFVGGKAMYSSKKSSILGYWGVSGDADNWAFPGSQYLRDYKLGGIAYRTKVGRYSSMQAEIHRYSVDSTTGNSMFDNQFKIPDYSKTMYSLSYATSPAYNWAARTSIGFEDNPKNIMGRDKSAFEFDGYYNADKFYINTFIEKYGNHFGPPVIINFDQGRQLSNTNFVYKLTPALSNNFSYNTSLYNSLETDNFSSESSSLSNYLSWRIDNFTNLRAGYRGFTRKNFGFVEMNGKYLTDEFFTAISRRFNKFTASLELRRTKERDAITELKKSRNSQIATLEYRPNQYHDFSIQYNNYALMDDLLPVNDFNRQWGINYRYSLPRDKGYFQLNYNNQTDFDTFLQVPVRSKYSSIAMEYWFSRVIGLNAYYYNSQQAGADTDYSSFNVSMRYILSKHSELTASYFSNPFETYYYSRGIPGRFKNVVYLQLRQSFGGPLEQRFEHQWLGTLRAQAYYYPKGGDPRDLRPLSSDISVMGFNVKNDTYESKIVDINREGVAEFTRVTPGQYFLELDQDMFDSHFTPVGGISRPVNIRPGSDRIEKFIMEASSSFYVVVWNDWQGKKELPQIYSGFEGIRVVVDDTRSAYTDENGVAIFEDLPPGAHTVKIDESSLPSGVIATTDTFFQKDVPPGESVENFGLQGWGKIKGRVFVIPIGESEKTEPLASAPITFSGYEFAETDGNGYYQADIPAGSHEVEVLGRKLGALYTVKGPEKKLKVDPDARIEQDYTLAYYGRIRGQIFELKDGKEVEYKKGGVVINFTGEPEYVYTDDDGSFLFRDLKMGRYEVSIEKEYIPKGFALVSSDVVPVRILSGTNAAIKFVIKKDGSSDRGSAVSGSIQNMRSKSRDRVPAQGKRPNLLSETVFSAIGQKGNKR